MTKDDKIIKLLQITNELEMLLGERISELHKVDGMQQCRHAYIYYRQFVYSIREGIKKL